MQSGFITREWSNPSVSNVCKRRWGVHMLGGGCEGVFMALYLYLWGGQWFCVSCTVAVQTDCILHWLVVEPVVSVNKNWWKLSKWCHIVARECSKSLGPLRRTWQEKKNTMSFKQENLWHKTATALLAHCGKWQYCNVRIGRERAAQGRALHWDHT